MAKKMGKALVVGAGISGIRSALDLAENGYGDTLIDREPNIGGILSQLDNQFPSNHCGMCKMLPLVRRDQSSQFCLRKGLFHDNIDMRLNTEVVNIEGEPGQFTVSLSEKATWVDPDRCVGCGACETVCPVEIPDAFNHGLTTHKAIYLPVPHTIPNPYVIDTAACTNCGECEKICPTQAVQLLFERRKEFRILVVDDELVVRDSLKDWLDEEGFSVKTAESGASALEEMSKVSYDLMLTDIKMPGMDGVELLKAAKELYPELCVLMMTAYATVETAVDAMKIGAEDYLMKPFDPEKMVAKVTAVYEAREAIQIRQLEVGAIVFSGGTNYFDPNEPKNIFGYQTIPTVITSLEMERLLSGTGPTQGRLMRPHDGKKIKKIAWIQCVGSRDVQFDADYCSSICCMVSIKEALLAKEKRPDPLDTTIFYMDMRTFGKSFQRYRDRAAEEHGVKFERARIHSINTESISGDALIRYVGTDGRVHSETFNLVVLAVGQRPAKGTEALSKIVDAPLNPWGFIQTEPFSTRFAGHSGILAGGSFAGLKDISESVLHASAASLEASRTIHAYGGGLSDESHTVPEFRNVSREETKMLVAVCTCGDIYAKLINADTLIEKLKQYNVVDQVIFIQQICTASGWKELLEAIRKYEPNRILLGACHPYLFIKKLKELSREVHLDAELIHVVDLISHLFARTDNALKIDLNSAGHFMTALHMGISWLAHIDPLPLTKIGVSQNALVVGGGIAGMYAALSIADHGYPVHLVEKSERLGGNLLWLDQTLEGVALEPYFKEILQAVEAHRLIDIHLQSGIISSLGDVGRFFTTFEDAKGNIQTVQHGTAILATGGSEAPTDAYGCGKNPAVITQKELETRFKRADFDARALDSVVMIQCVGSRQEPRNYCSRVCCPTSLKHALRLKKANPKTAVYILYRDMMTPGFTESYFTAARKAGVIFIQYDSNNPPAVKMPSVTDASLIITVNDPILSRPLEIKTDLLVMATGIVPHLPEDLANMFGVNIDRDGFFLEAESKWRPVDALKEGVYCCGLALSPRSIPETIVTAGAAAQRSLRILANGHLVTAKNIASVRHSLCSLCERCIETCPYHARRLDQDNEKIIVNPAMCQGCGECASACPNSASILKNFDDVRFLGLIDTAIGSTWEPVPVADRGH